MFFFDYWTVLSPLIQFINELAPRSLWFTPGVFFFYKMTFAVTFSPCIRYRAKARDQWSPHSLLVKVKWHLSERRLWQGFNLGNRTQFLILRDKIAIKWIKCKVDGVSWVAGNYNIVLVHLALRPCVLQNGAIKCFFTKLTKLNRKW